MDVCCKTAEWRSLFSRITVLFLGTGGIITDTQACDVLLVATNNLWLVLHPDLWTSSCEKWYYVVSVLLTGERVRLTLTLHILHSISRLCFEHDVRLSVCPSVTSVEMGIWQVRSVSWLMRACRSRPGLLYSVNTNSIRRNIGGVWKNVEFCT